MCLLLICSVGGTPQPIVASIKKYQPARVLLWHTAGTKATASQAIVDSNIAAGCVDYRLVQDEQDFASCVSDARTLRTDYSQWKARSDSHEVIVDFTGGTKVMSAALALVTHRWDCRFSYVAGTQRTKEGVGIVVDGSEKAIRSDNPLDLLAYQPVVDAVQLFNAGLPAAAEKLLDPVGKRSDLNPSVKRSVTAVVHVLRAYAKWDAFQHGDAIASFANALRCNNDLAAIFPTTDLQNSLRSGKQACERIVSHDNQSSIDLVLDLIANAERRARLGLYDDAVARLYRAIEAFAQAELGRKGIDTSRVEETTIPKEVRNLFYAKPEDGVYKLGLHDSYQLLRYLDEPKARPFFQAKLDSDQSPLVARNQSILAHGFQPVTDKTYERLKAAIDQLVATPTCIEFPKLPDP